MKYYAVTEDPNELLHYGRLGMKWGKHIFGDKPRSPGYHRALDKLRGFASKTKNAVQKSSTQHAINKQHKQEEKYAKAVEKAQNRINKISNLSAYSNDYHDAKVYEKQAKAAIKESKMIAKAAANERKAQIKADKLAVRNSRKFARNESRMDKYMQQAREGRLHYGKLSEEQVRRITDRLALERSARSLGNTEKPKFRRRMKDALQEGILQGVTQGTAAGMKEIAVAKVQNRLLNKRALDKQNRNEAERQKEASRIKNRKTHKEVKEDIRDELYEEAIKEGEGMFARRAFRVKNAGNKLNDIEAKRLERERTRKLEARIKDEIDLENNQDYQKMLENREERKRIRDVQNRLNSETDEKWTRYLNETGQTDADARKRAGFSADQIKGASKAQIMNQRRLALAKVERENKEEAYKKIVEDTQKRLENEAKEEAIKKLDEKYEHDMDKYKSDKAKYEGDKDRFDAELQIYERDYSKWERDGRRGPKPNYPDPVKYSKPKKPDVPDYDSVKISINKDLPSYDQYMALKELGLGGNYFNNSNGNGKKKPKSKN